MTKSPTKKSFNKVEQPKKRRDASIESEEEVEENLSAKRNRSKKQVQPFRHDEMMEDEQEEERYNDLRNVADKRLKGTKRIKILLRL